MFTNSQLLPLNVDLILRQRDGTIKLKENCIKLIMKKKLEKKKTADQSF